MTYVPSKCMQPFADRSCLHAWLLWTSQLSQYIPCCLQQFRGYTKTKNLSGMLGLIPLAVLSSAVYRVDYTHNICCLLLFAFAFCRPLYACVCVLLFSFWFLFIFVAFVACFKIRCVAYTVDLNVFHPRVPIFSIFIFSLLFLFIFFILLLSHAVCSLCCSCFFFRACVCVCVVFFFFFSWLPVGLTVELSISRWNLRCISAVHRWVFEGIILYTHSSRCCCCCCCFNCCLFAFYCCCCWSFVRPKWIR